MQSESVFSIVSSSRHLSCSRGQAHPTSGEFLFHVMVRKVEFRILQPASESFDL